MQAEDTVAGTRTVAVKVMRGVSEGWCPFVVRNRPSLFMLVKNPTFDD